MQNKNYFKIISIAQNTFYTSGPTFKNARIKRNAFTLYITQSYFYFGKIWHGKNEFYNKLVTKTVILQLTKFLCNGIFRKYPSSSLNRSPVVHRLRTRSSQCIQAYTVRAVSRDLGSQNFRFFESVSYTPPVDRTDNVLRLSDRQRVKRSV